MKLVIVVLMEKLVCRGFATYYVINGIAMNVVKRNGWTLGFEKKVCLIGNCSLSDRFHYVVL